MALGMARDTGEAKATSSRPLSALPSVQARALAFGAIIVGGLFGGLIGFSTVKVGCEGSCGTPQGIGSLSGAVFAAAGVAVIAVLVLRAMGEWRSIQEKRQLDIVIGAASAFLQSSAPPPEPPPPTEVTDEPIFPTPDPPSDSEQ